MGFSQIKYLLLTLCLLPLCTYAQTTVQDSAAGTDFPKEVSFEDGGKNYQLQITGVSTRKKLIVKVYSIAHYLQGASEFNKSNVIQEIMKDDRAKQFTIKWMRAVTAEQMQTGYKESFQKSLSPSELGQVQSAMQQYLGFFNQDVNKGDEHVIRWLPGGIIEVLINGKQAGKITNTEFAKGLWDIWFGPHSVVNRDQLISFIQ